MAKRNLDNKIINKLLDDGRASFREIAEELDVSVTTVSNHVKELTEKEIINSFKPVLDYSKLGYNITAVFMIKGEGNKINELTEHLREKNNLTDVYEVTGDFDVICIGKFKDTEEMDKYIKEILNKESVDETNTNIVLSNIKENSDIKIN